MFTFELPEIGEGVVEGEIVQWLVEQGDVIAVDQPVCEIMTDKATVEISTPKGGRVHLLHGEPGDVIKVHAPLAEIDTNGSAEASPQPIAPKASPPVVSGKAVATPAVRRRARELEVDLGRVPGSGKGGRVLQKDLQQFVRAPVAVAQAKAPPTGKRQRIEIIGLRRKIAEQMVKSRFTAPHFTYVDEVDMTSLDDMRRRLKPRAAERGIKLTFLPFLMKALVMTFREFPNVNANVEEDPLTLVVEGDVNIGIATDTPRGLFVPVVKSVERLSVLELAARIADLTERTRAGTVSLDELSGGTFTITSVGAFGGMFATPILNHPEVAILGVNRIHERPVVRGGQIVVRKMLYLSSSFDHRIIDGAVAARWTTALKEILEAPETLFWEHL
ncbi:MAG TPA: dihydrolipoamide acetyltransferase family protein [Myxococcota bacterium]|nr:dihydrolipoamide acetyltransferase family protein [Myxococcota bacterium]